MTRYMLLIYTDTDMGEEEGADMQQWHDYTDWLGQRGWSEGGDGLQDVDEATTVRVRDGERLVTDGPFAETKEALGGYYLLDVDNLDDAIEAAGVCPAAPYGTIELRPVMELPGRAEE